MRIIHRAPAPAGVLLLAALTVATPSDTAAQGFGVYEHGTCVMGRAGTAVALPCLDGSTIFFNPSGLVAGDPGWTVTAGLTVIAAGGGFTFDRTGREVDLQNDPIPVPHAFVRYGHGERLAFGLGLYVPYGLGTEWPRTVDGEVFSGAFSGYDNSLESIYVQPTMAYRVHDRVALGAGLTVVHSSLELNQLVDLSEQRVPEALLPPGTEPPTFGQLGVPRGTAFADATLEGDSDFEFGFNVGATIRLAEPLSLGLRYLSAVELEYDGTAVFRQVATDIVLPPNNPLGLPAGTELDDLLTVAFTAPGALAPQGVATRIEMPRQFVAGVAYDATRELTLLFDWQWTDWSAFDRVPLEFEVLPDDERIENFEDTHAFRFGVDYEWDEFWDVRLGYLYHGAAAPDETVTPLLPESTRNEFTAGLGWNAPGGFTVDLAYQFIDQDDRRGRTREPQPGQDPIDVTDGLFSFHAHLFGATLSYAF